MFAFRILKCSKVMLARSKIYTRTGDKGTSALFSGERMPKSSIYFNALGTVDELNSNIGHAVAHCQDEKLDAKYLAQLKFIQSRLFDIGSHVATPRKKETKADKIARTEFLESHTQDLEKWIDEITSQLPPLHNFVLPSGGVSATALHLSRSVCRRCERILVDLLNEQVIDMNVYKYVNRLSDYLFTLARYSAMKGKHPEDEWQKITKS